MLCKSRDKKGAKVMSHGLCGAKCKKLNYWPQGLDLVNFPQLPVEPQKKALYNFFQNIRTPEICKPNLIHKVNDVSPLIKEVIAEQLRIIKRETRCLPE